MSSPNLNVLITLGGLLSYSSCVLFGLDAVLGEDWSSSTVVCQVHTWLLTLSFTLVFGAMLVKSWRVYRIFHKAGTQGVVIKDEKLVAIVVILVFVDVIILSLWHGLDPMKAEVMTAGLSKQDTPVLSNWTAIAVGGCSCRHMSVWIFVLFLYKAALLISGVYLSWATRNVVLPSMNETKFTILSTFTTTILCTAATALRIGDKSIPDAAAGCLAIAVWLSTTACLLLLFAPKMKLVLIRKDTKIVRHAMKISTSSFPPTESSGQLQQEMCRLISENQLIKNSLNEKFGAIQSLQDHLDSAQTKLEQLEEEVEGMNDSGLDFEVSSAASSQRDETKETTMHVQPRSPDNSTPQQSVTVISETDSKSFRPKVHRSESMNSFRSPLNKRPDFKAGSLRSDKGSTRSRIAALRDSIPEDLQHAHIFSRNLRDPICKDLDQLSIQDTSQRSADRNRLFSVGSREGLAGSIAESYNFGRDGNDWSHIQQFLQAQQPYQPSNMDTTTTRKANRKSIPGIPDSIQVLSSEQMYPEFHTREQCRPKISKTQRISREILQGHGAKYMTAQRKSKVHDNVYLIQYPKMKHFITNVVQKQYFQTPDGTVCFEVLDSFV